MTQKQKLYFDNQFMPVYSKGEELFNMISHAFGGLVAIIILLMSMRRSVISDLRAIEVISLVVYGFCAIILYTASSVYHGLNEGLISKKIFRIIDHCTIYLLIAGTYTPICIIALSNTWQGSYILISEWIACVLGIVINGLWLNKKIVKIISIFLYIFTGWLIVFIPGAINYLSRMQFIYILSGGILYSIGVIFYALGKNIKWTHSVFHIFCVLGTIAQFIGIYLMII